MQQVTVDIQHPNCFGFLHQSQCQMISFGLRYLEKSFQKKISKNLNLSKTTASNCRMKHGECEEKVTSADALRILSDIIPLRIESISKSFLILHNTCSYKESVQTCHLQN